MRLATIILLLCTAFAPTLRAQPAVSGERTAALTFRVDNLRRAQGTVWVGVYTGAEDFLNRDRARLEAVPVTTTGSLTITLTDLVPGRRYALGLFHDVDENGEFDTNWLGLPAEPWAFSGTLASRLRVPRFEEVAFVFEPGRGIAPLRLRTWF